MGYYDDHRTRGAIDNLLFDLVVIESNQGIDSTDDEKWLADNEKKVVIKKIRDLDEQYFQDVFNLNEKYMKKVGIIDLETTDYTPKNGKIVEIGIVELNLETGEKKIVFDKVIKGTSDMSLLAKSWVIQNSSLTGGDVVKAKPLEYHKPGIQQIINNLDGITAFNSGFDFRFLDSVGIVVKNRLDCPMKLSRPIVEALDKNGRVKNPSVQEAYDFFFPGNDYIEKHRGADDAFHEADIVLELYKRGVFKV